MSKRRAGKPNTSSLPDKRLSHIIEERRTVLSVGPLPSPDVLKEYEQLLTGAAERIFVMAENEAKHRHAVASRALDAEASIAQRGQWCGLSLGIGGLLTSLIALYLGSPYVAGIIGGGTTLGLVSAFVGGRFFGRQQEQKKSP